MIDHTTFKGALSTDVLEAVIRVQAADKYPLYASLLGSGRKLLAKAEEISWWVSKSSSRRGQINNGGAAYTAGSTTLVVDDVTIYSPGDVLLSEATGERMFVVATVPGSNSLAVTRAIGTTTASAQSVADDAFLVNVGNAHGEGASSPGHRTGTKTQVKNIIQTVRRAVEMSGRMGRIETDTEDERAFQRVDALEATVEDIEHALFFGSKNANLTDANGKRVTTMGGLLESIITNVDNIAGTLTKPLFHQFAEEVFATGSRVKDLYAGPTALTAIHDLYEGQVRYTNPQANVGLRVSVITTPHGDFNLIPHPDFKGALAGDAVAVDKTQLKLRPTKGGDLVLKENTEAKGDDSSRDEVFAELSFEYGYEGNHGRMTGIEAA